MSDRPHRSRHGFFLAGIPLVLLLAGAGSGQSAPPAAVDFTREIRPILAARCFGCHGSGQQKNGLRLDVRAAALEGGDSGPAILPGRSQESELIRRLIETDASRRMPPGQPLPAAEIRRLRAWVDQGASWPEDPGAGTAVRSSHWAFQPVTRPRLPAVRSRHWVINPIDRFILEALERKGLRPSPPAERVTLIRRVSLDLTGLPPTVQEVDAFVNDTGPGAYERLVERLLASPHYGERWGRLWLDQARYADSNGYTIDSARSIWKYRDWVIAALNQDMPFDRFTIEQIAGDMLPNATESQVIATGFHRNTLINEEGGTDREQFRVEAVVDRVNTTGAVFLGLTLGCAQCHTHKYDPITQKEYYRFFAFLNNQEEPNLAFPTPEQAAEQGRLQGQLAAAQKDLEALDGTAKGRLAAWEARVRRQKAIPWTVLRPAEVRTAGGTALARLEDGSLLAGGSAADQDTYTVTADIPAGGVTAVRLEVLTHDSLPGRGPGLARGNFLLTDFSVTAAPLGAPAASAPVRIAAAWADHSQKDYPISNAIDRDARSGWAINVMPGEGRLNSDRTALFLLESPAGAPGGARLTVTLRQEHPNRGYLIGRFRLSVSTAPEVDGTLLLPAPVRDALALPADQRSKEQRALLETEFRKADPERARLAARITDLEARQRDLAKAIPPTMVLRELKTPRETHVHIRGDFLRKGPPVRPGVPAVLPPLPSTGASPSRLDLARWLVDRNNPLTPRVIVNRVWQAYFGVGLVETENDFGTQGTPPSHPELLDWLAFVFASPRSPAPALANAGRTTALPDQHAAGWSLKALHRMIVTSATYRQSSRARPDLAAVDPANRLLGRQGRLRLDAELIRDAGLAASGLLSRKIGGPSVFPPQPAGLDAFTQTRKNWTPSTGEDRYRRGLYTFMWRSNPFAMFATFDAPNGQVTCTRRGRSNTPLGSLMLANDQSMVEMAQALAARVLREAPASEPERLRYAFRLCLAREPAPSEAARLLAFYRSQVTAFLAAPADAEIAAPRDRTEGVDTARAAAWTAVARVLINLDEFITRE